MTDNDLFCLLAVGLVFCLLAKLDGLLCFIVIIIAGLWYGVDSLYSAWQQRVAAKELSVLKIKHRALKIYSDVRITATFDDKLCSQQNGLLVKIANNSDVAIEYVGWKLSVYQPECRGCPTKKDEKFVSYKTLQPQTEHLECYHTPVLQNNHPPQEALYAIVSKEVQPSGEKIITYGAG